VVTAWLNTKALSAQIGEPVCRAFLVAAGEQEPSLVEALPDLVTSAARDYFWHSDAAKWCGCFSQARETS
jgi:hypothetical protein